MNNRGILMGALRRTALCLLAPTLVLAACGTAAVEQAAPPSAFREPIYEWGSVSGETLQLWTPENELNRPYYTRALESYQEKTGNRIEVREFPKSEFVPAAAAAFAAQAQMPDLLLSYGGANIEPLDPDRNFYDFTDAAWVDDLTSTSINQTVYHGRVVGLPFWEASISGTLYNKKIFERLGIEVPRTQEEFWQACATLLQNGVTPVYLPGGEISMLLYQFPLDTLVEDPAVLEALNSGETGYRDLPGMEQVVRWYAGMAQKGYFGEGYERADWDGMSGALESGDYAMMLCWDTWLYTDFQGDPAQFGLMPAFVGVPEEGTFEGPNLALLIVNRGGPRVDAALDLVRFLADPYNYNAAFEGIYTAPVFRRQVASISTPQYVEAERGIERQFRDSTAWLRIRGFSQMDASCILDCMAGRCSVEQCLEGMDRLRQERLEQIDSELE